MVLPFQNELTCHETLNEFILKFFFFLNDSFRHAAALSSSR